LTESRPPNIILTIADDQRGTALGCGGIEQLLTPALDALASRGARFTQAQHFGSCHGAVCVPSRAMLHTGTPYFQLEDSLLNCSTYPKSALRTPLLGEKLAQAGYHTFGTGKWHNGVPSFHRSFQAGSSIFFAGMNDHWFTPVHDYDPSGQYPPEARHFADGFSTEVFAQSAIDFIRSRRDADQPFFCYCAFTAPHDPRTPPDAWRRMYPPHAIALPPNTVPRFFSDSPSPPGVRPAFDNGSLDERDELLLGIPRDAKEIQRETAAYYGMISHMDDWIGRIHQAVAESGLLDNTIIIHTADHGLAIGQHGLMGKQNLYRHSVNVPLIMAGPDIPRGHVSDALCYQHDLHPTLAHLAGADPGPPTFQSLLPLLRGGAGRTHLGAAFRSTQRSIRDSRYKLIEYRIGGEHFAELFDLSEDPWETCNFIDDPRFIPLIATLRGALGEWQHEAGDSAWPSPD